MTKGSTYVFAGGGTGGHLFPGIAVAEELVRVDGTVRIIFSGSQRTVEREILERYGYVHRPLSTQPSTLLCRRPFRFAWRHYRAYREAKDQLRSDRPAAVVGLGGYASVPVVLAAAALDIPRLLLEQNVVPGRATRWLLKRATWTCYAFDETVGAGTRCRAFSVPGNPVRREISELFAQTSGREDLPVLLILGGSQGAVSLNELVIGVVNSLRRQLSAWRIVHQTGPQQVDEIRRRYTELDCDAVVEPFFENLADWYHKATLAVSRAGGTTLAELACARVPAILIPYPRSIGDHQLHNAAVFQRAGAAEIVEQTAGPHIAQNKLTGALERLIGAGHERDGMREAMATLARPHAARNVADCLYRCAAARAA